MATRPRLPVVGPEGNLSRYLQDIRKFPMLEHDEEFMLAKSWREFGCQSGSGVASRAEREGKKKGRAFRGRGP